MQYIYCLMLLVGVSFAAQPAPVYRSAPAVLAPKSTSGPSTPGPLAEERESQAFPTPGQDIKGVAGTVTPVTVPTKATVATAPGNEQVMYKVYYIPGHHQAGFNSGYGQQPTDGHLPTGYQTAPGGTSDGYFNNIKWMDWLVGASSLALVGLGSALLYPNLPSLRQRAMRELAEINSDDAARMAKTVMKAIARFSEMNARND